MTWWTRPLVRMIAALMLPFVVPAIIIGILWALPGDPATILCPPGLCPDLARAELAERWHLDEGPGAFYSAWLSSAMSGDFGRSWRVEQGVSVNELLWGALPQTAALVGLAIIPLFLASVLAAAGWAHRRLDFLWQGFGLVPAVIGALAFAAVVNINYGALSFDGWPGTLRVLLGGLTLGLADGAFAGAVLGTRAVFEEEHKRRYVQMATLRGESTLSNTLPNVLPALAGQFRSRLLHLLSGAVIVEVVLRIDGLGDLLWAGTLVQDFGVVLAAAFGFALLSGVLMFAQATAEIGAAVYSRTSPVKA